MRLLKYKLNFFFLLNFLDRKRAKIGLLAPKLVFYSLSAFLRSIQIFSSSSNLPQTNIEIIILLIISLNLIIGVLMDFRCNFLHSAHIDIFYIAYIIKLLSKSILLGADAFPCRRTL